MCDIVGQICSSGSWKELKSLYSGRKIKILLLRNVLSFNTDILNFLKKIKKITNLMRFLNRTILQNQVKFFGSKTFR